MDNLVVRIPRGSGPPVVLGLGIAGAVRRMPLRGRVLEGELMDDPGLPEPEHRRALAALRRINRFSRVVDSLWPGVAAAAAARAAGSGGEVVVVDVATGSGDVLVGVLSRAKGAGIAAHGVAVDVSPVALAETAARAAEAGVRVETREQDVTATGLAGADGSADVAMCSLFLHHLTEEQVVGVLREMRRVGRRVLVSDLERCRLGLIGAWLAGRLGTRSRIVRVDAVRSVRAAFTVDELKGLADRAGLTEAQVRRVWPFRMLLMWPSD